MKIDRNLTLFDYKVFYVVSQLPTINLSIEISDDKYKKPEEYNPEGLWFSEFRSVSRATRYYLVGEEFQHRINFRLILYLCYVNFFLFYFVIFSVPADADSV